MKSQYSCMAVGIKAICFLLLLVSFQMLHAQDCKYFNELLQKSKTLWVARQFEKAMNQVAAAREDCPEKAAEADAQLVHFSN